MTLTAVGIIVLAATLSACGGDTETADQGATTTGDSAANDAANSDTQPDAEPEAPETESESESGAQSVTITMGDGTVYVMENMAQCETSGTDPDGYVANGFDLKGESTDGAVAFTLIRNGVEEVSATLAGSLEGEFIGDSATMIYAFQQETAELTVDGPSLLGTITGKAIGSARPHGDESAMTIDARC